MKGHFPAGYAKGKALYQYVCSVPDCDWTVTE